MGQRTVWHDPTLHRWAWVAAAVFFIGGDAVTTGIGLTVPGVIELNPTLAPVLAETGIGYLVVVKVLVVVGGLGLYRLVPHSISVGVPLGFATVGVTVTGWNLLVLGVAALA